MAPDRMLAVQLTQYGSPLIARQVAVPLPGPGEVLIRVAAAAINPSDLRFIETAPGARNLPLIPGLEGGGTVVAAGAGVVPRLLVGRRVAFAQNTGGAWAEYAVCAAARCIPLGRKVSLEQAAALIVNPLTVLALVDIARRQKHTAFVSTAAAGAVGRMLHRLGTASGMSVINVVRRPEQAELLRSLGAQFVLDSSDGGFVQALQLLTHRLKATLAFDAVGGPAFRLLLEAMPAGSEVVVYGALAEEPSSFASRSVAVEGKRVSGFYLGNHAAQRSLLATIRDIVRVQRLVGSELRTTVSHRLPLAEAQRAVESYRRDMTAGKMLLIADPAQR